MQLQALVLAAVGLGGAEEDPSAEEEAALPTPEELAEE